MNYDRIAQTAQRLVAKNGRSITLVKLNATSADPDKPWRGAEDPRGDDAEELVVPAVFVGPTALGFAATSQDLFKGCSQICIVATTADLIGFNEVLDADGKRWKIAHIEKLKPAQTTLLYYIGVKR